MSHWPQVRLRYDGSFAGFLCCVGQCFARREYPFYFFTQEQVAPHTPYPLREVKRDEAYAKEVYAALKERLSLPIRQVVDYAFLTCLPRRERHIFDFIYAGAFGANLLDPADERVFLLQKAIHRLLGEADAFSSLLPFSRREGLLLAQIKPQNRILPLLRPKLCRRLAEEDFVLHDRSHQEALLHAKGQWQLLPTATLSPEAQADEMGELRALWSQFYQKQSQNGNLYVVARHA